MNPVHYTDILPTVMESDQVKDVNGRVLIGSETGAGNFTMRLFEMGPGGHTPLHTHDWEHEVFVHQGEGEVLLEGQWQPLKAGSAVFVPPSAEHQFRNPSDTPFAFVCLVPSTAPEL